MTSRRAFIARIAGGSAAVVVGSRFANAQARGMIHDSTVQVRRDSTNLFAMDQSAAVPVQLPPKPGAAPSMTPLERDALERRIHCQCGCTLDVFTCRTTDFSCQVSPAMHRDVMALVEGGHSAQEIIDAFVKTYGQRALMAPAKSGFNLLAWVTPGAALIVGGIALTFVLRGLGRKRARAVPAAVPDLPTSATPDELARLEAAVRGDDRS